MVGVLQRNEMGMETDEIDMATYTSKNSLQVWMMHCIGWVWNGKHGTMLLECTGKENPWAAYKARTWSFASPCPAYCCSGITIGWYAYWMTENKRYPFTKAAQALHPPVQRYWIQR